VVDVPLGALFDAVFSILLMGFRFVGRVKECNVGFSIKNRWGCDMRAYDLPFFSWNCFLPVE
jgi:hypothetical protein